MRKEKGFTLLELLVVIAVIGILAAVILSQVAEARNKGKDAAIRQSFKEFEKLLYLEYSDIGSYANLQGMPFLCSPEECDTAFTSSQYATNAQDICKQIIANNNSCFVAAHIGGPDPNVQKYSISTTLNAPIYVNGTPTGHDYCVGSKGTYDGTSFANGNQTQPGCLNNP